MNWVEVNEQATSCQVGHLTLLVWTKYNNVYWEVRVSGTVLQTGVSKDVAMARFDASACAWGLANDITKALT